MAACYSETMPLRHPPLPPKLPAVLLVTDERNDAMLEEALLRLPRGSGVVFRHYHLAADERQRRFVQVAALARARGHAIFLSGSTRHARRWGADGAYGNASLLAGGPHMTRLVAAHSLREIGAARRTRADAVLLSPVFVTRSHLAAQALGPVRFRLLARNARIPVIALGGMTRARARRLSAFPWAAIDGLTPRSPNEGATHAA